MSESVTAEEVRRIVREELLSIEVDRLSAGIEAFRRDQSYKQASLVQTALNLLLEKRAKGVTDAAD